MDAAKKKEREKLVLNDREQRAWMKLSANLRTRVARILEQPELEFAKPDLRKGENSHWHEKRALKIFLVKTPDGRKRLCTSDEATALVDCSEKFLVDYMNVPLNKFERVRVYRMDDRDGETTIIWAAGHAS